MKVRLGSSMKVRLDFANQPSAQSPPQICAAAVAGLPWKRFRPRSGQPPNCSFHQHLLGPAQYH
jgi:hypothetical protein